MRPSELQFSKLFPIQNFSINIQNINGSGGTSNGFIFFFVSTISFMFYSSEKFDADCFII